MDRFIKKNGGEFDMKNPEPLVNLGDEIDEVTFEAEVSQDIDPPSPKRTKNTRDMTDISVDGAPDIALDLSENPKQPNLSYYKQTTQGGQTRSFQKAWYTGRPWLEYSQKAIAIFCYACRAFPVAGSELTWTCLGFSNWKISMEMKKVIKLHEASKSHHDSMIQWTDFQNSLRIGSIETKLGGLTVQVIRDNRHFIKTIAQVVTLCAVQDLPLRGHLEGRLIDYKKEVIDPGFNCGFRNRGNFLEIFTAFGVHDKVILEKLNGELNAQYVHHSIQDSVLSILAKSVSQDILKDLKTAKYLALLVDESRDCGKHEQISVCVRYVCERVLNEDFFNFVRAKGLDANSIMNKLKEVLAVMGVCARDFMIAQCYDGASTMSGRLGGLQTPMRQEVCPMALYVHWWAHRLNLGVVACCQDLDKAVSFFDNIQQLYTFFSASVRHDFFEKTQEILGKYKGRHRELKALSKTRWCCQAEACSAVAITLGPIIAAVEHFAQDRSADRRVAAQSIVSFIDTDFVICLQLFRKVLTLSLYSANYLQDKHLDIGIAIDHIDTLRMSLSKTDLFDEIWETAKALVD